LEFVIVFLANKWFEFAFTKNIKEDRINTIILLFIKAFLL